MDTSDWIILVAAVACLLGAILLIRVVSRTMIEAHFERKAHEREVRALRRRAVLEQRGIARELRPSARDDRPADAPAVERSRGPGPGHDVAPGARRRRREPPS